MGVGETPKPRNRCLMKDDTVRRLNALDQEYTAAVNSAVAEDRDDLIQQLIAEYPDAALEIMNDEAA
jgi:hypothetical protein